MSASKDTVKGLELEGKLCPELAGLAAAVKKITVQGPGAAMPRWSQQPQQPLLLRDVHGSSSIMPREGKGC